jgi:SAM-dependent methyltransferase
MAKKLKQQHNLVSVHGQYEEYPYPYRDYELEKTQLFVMEGEYLGELNHYLYNGKQSFKNKFRVLVAGGGTGDSSTFLGEQLKNTDAEVVYLDFSKTSTEIAKKRAEVRGLKNIKFINDSILNIPKLNLGKFDYINCIGVLHHLESPSTGLQILADSLNNDGGMSIMIYGKYGRTGIYHMQEIMRMVNEGITNRAEEISNAKIVLNSLPASCWFKRGEDLAIDHRHNDSGIYDLFLHKQDRAYSIPEMYEFIHNTGLNFVEFSTITTKLNLRIENYIQDPILLTNIKQLSIAKQQAICELIIGTLKKHSFYASKKANTTAKLYDLNNVPYFYRISGLPQRAYDYINNNQFTTIDLKFSTIFTSDINIKIQISRYTKYLFKHMISESKSLLEIFDGIRKDLGEDIKDEILIIDAQNTLTPFIGSGAILLRDKSIEHFTFKHEL